MVTTGLAGLAGSKVFGGSDIPEMEVVVSNAEGLEKEKDENYGGRRTLPYV